VGVVIYHKSELDYGVYYIWIPTSPCAGASESCPTLTASTQLALGTIKIQSPVQMIDPSMESRWYHGSQSGCFLFLERTVHCYSYLHDRLLHMGSK
jgi:hypothetical protein